MRKSNTKERLVDAAMNLFSLKGYDGTGVDEIAESVGIKGPTIYKYYKGKGELLKAVIKRAEDEYCVGMGFAENPADKINSGENLKQFALKSLDFSLGNETAKKMRRLITMEQYRNEMLAELTTKHQISYLQEVYTKIFQSLMDQGQMTYGNPQITAFEFIAPVALLVQMIDREPDRKDEALKIINEHIDLFIEKYGII